MKIRNVKVNYKEYEDVSQQNKAGRKQHVIETC